MDISSDGYSRTLEYVADEQRTAEVLVGGFARHLLRWRRAGLEAQPEPFVETGRAHLQSLVNNPVDSAAHAERGGAGVTVFCRALDCPHALHQMLIVGGPDRELLERMDARAATQRHIAIRHVGGADLGAGGVAGDGKIVKPTADFDEQL